MKRLNRNSWQIGTLSAAALVLAACGGGGGSSSGDNGGTSLSDSEQAALAGSAGTATITSAESFTASQTSSSGTMTTSSTSLRTTQDRSSLNCDTGTGFSDDTPGLDITAQNFPEPPFSNDEGSMSGGTDNNRSLRATDCETTVSTTQGTTTTLINGATDTMERDPTGTSGNEVAQVLRLGGNQGDTARPDTSSFFTTEVSQNGSTVLDFQARGEVFTCAGCVSGNLNDFAGDANRDETVSMFLDLQLGDGQNTYSYTLGESLNNPVTLESRVVSSSITAIEFNGSVDFSAGGNCDFGATYDTKQALQIENYQQSDSTITGGEIEVTLDNGVTQTVTFDSDGTVNVNGNPVDVDSIDADCNGFDDVNTS